MDLERKTAILTSAARYDVSCASSGSARRAPDRGIGNTAMGGICHSWSADGRCISLLKILYSNHCVHDCAYCVNRVCNDQPRASFSVGEVVRLTLDFYRRNYIEGLFLSSGVWRSPDYTMEQLALVAETLRRERFGGYIHLKAIPGADMALIRRAALAADRISVNIELPSEVSLNRLAPQKHKDDIIVPMREIGRQWRYVCAERRKKCKPPPFAPAGQSTQMIVGASPESDRQILFLAQRLYQSYALKRVYYSAYVPVSADVRLPPPGSTAELHREHRLYQADWLIRCYKFDARELLSEDSAFLDQDLDPKAAWALRHPECFPVDVNAAPYEMLLRTPGIGFKSAARLVETRRISPLRETDLSKIGMVMKRARFFITLNGRLLPGVRFDPESLRRSLLPALSSRRIAASEQQLDLFEQKQDRDQ